MLACVVSVFGANHAPANTRTTVKENHTMPKITIDGKSKELASGDTILASCEDLGVPFGCQAGSCGTCVIVVESGMENLEPKNDLEDDLGLKDNERLACQAKIQDGEVVATW
jgi:ferredoxin